MTTKLKDPVFRETEIKITDRSVIIGLEIIDEKPVFSIRLKGYTSGWYADVGEVALYAVNMVTRTSGGSKLPIAPQKMEEWKHGIQNQTVAE